MAIMKRRTAAPSPPSRWNRAWPMLIEAGGAGLAQAAAEAARCRTGHGGNDPDLEVRHRHWLRDRSPRAQAARSMAARWAKLSSPAAGAAGDLLANAIALAFPDRLSRRRDSSGEHWQSVGGRGFRLDPASPLARSEWLAVAEVAGRQAPEFSPPRQLPLTR
jgi:ATP-dependent helicase HrpB